MSADSQPLQRAGLPAVAAVSCGSLLYTLDANIATVALPFIARDLGLATSTAVILASAYNLVLAMALLPLAAIADKVGHRQVFTLGFWIYLAGAGLSPLTRDFETLVAARMVQSVGGAALLGVSLSLVRMIYPERQLGRGLGFNTLLFASGVALAPVLAGALIDLASWHWVFAAGAPLALAGLALGRCLPDSPKTNHPFDKLGALLCAASFGLLIVGFQAVGERWDMLLWLGSLGLGGLLLTGMVWHEQRVAVPVLPVDLFAARPFALAVASVFFAVLATTCLMLSLPFTLSAVGFDAALIGAALLPYAVGAMVFAPLSGILSDRISPNLLCCVGLAIAIAGCLAFATLPAQPDYFDVAWRAGVVGMGFPMFFSPNGRLVVASAPMNRMAGATSMVSTMRMFGQALGTVLLSLLLAVGAGESRIALVAAALAGLALVLCLWRMALRADQTAA